MKSIGAFFADILKFVIKFFVVIALIAGLFGAFSTTTKSDANLAIIDLKGPIMGDTKILNQIYKISENKEIKGVLLFIDSPGGALAPSFELSGAIKALNEKIPVVAYAGGTMASGSYLGGVWAREIYANKGAMIGSIGVIMQGMNIQNLTDKIGISTQTVQAGEYKQAGTIMREWSELERQSLQELTDKSYELFTTEVAKARKLNINAKHSWANARVFLADDAKKLGLIDRVGTLQDAKLRVETLSGVSSPVWPKTPLMDKYSKALESSFSGALVNLMGINLR